MDHQSTVKLSVDQAIFTSVRSLMGEGYRLIAATSGVSNEERMEITRNCPSHGGLCGDLPSDEGLMSYTLSSGRHCVAYSCNAGPEHTGRGGQRIYTHMVLLDQATFRQLKFDPVRVHQAIAKAIDHQPMLDPSARLSRLELTVEEPQMTPPIKVDHTCHIISAVLSRQRMIVVGLPSPFQTLQRIIMAAPIYLRESLSLTVGLKFSIVRPTQLCFISRDPGDIRRNLRGQEIQWLDVDAPCPQMQLAWPYNGWLDLIRRKWWEGRFSEICQLTDKMNFPIKGTELDRIALLCGEMDIIKETDLSNLEQLVIKYENYHPSNDVERTLINDLRSAIHIRLLFLQKEHEMAQTE